MNNQINQIEITELNAGERLDKILAAADGDFSRNYAQELIEGGLVHINNKVISRSNVKVKLGDIITFEKKAPLELDIVASNLPLDIVYQDADVVVLNKAIGMVVHPAAGHQNDTLVNALLFHIDNLSSINGVIRPGIVHRIDKDTSGLLVVAKNNKAHTVLSTQLQDKTLYREYIALIFGDMKDLDVIIDVPIARSPHDRKKMAVIAEGKAARTHVRVLQRFGDYTLIQCRLETGRTHQIRVHLSYIGHPLVGDLLYTTRKHPFNLHGQFLHARKIGFIHPTTAENCEFEAPMPQVFQDVLTQLNPTHTGEGK
ncbi:ribosomal large subunit pseudouridine synthase D [Erysipelotrichaceae bacterium]|nr:ribosomal large subunit pseudouridine synthase D [Erysipelotrichaceae bacterium]